MRSRKHSPRMVPKIFNRLKLIEITPNFGHYTIVWRPARAEIVEHFVFPLMLLKASEAKLWDLSYILEIGYGCIVIIKEGSLENITAMLESGHPIYDLYVNLHPNHV